MAYGIKASSCDPLMSLQGNNEAIIVSCKLTKESVRITMFYTDMCHTKHNIVITIVINADYYYGFRPTWNSVCKVIVFYEELMEYIVHLISKDY